MIDLRERLQELAEAAARDGRTAGPMAAIRRGRRRRRRLAGGTAALLAAVLVAGAVGTDHLGPGGRELAPASRTPTRPGFPAKLATYTPKDSAEAAVLRLLTDRSEGLGACKGGQPGHVRIIATGPLPKGQGIWMIAARPPLPTEQRLCWMFAFGNDRDLGAPVAHLGKPPPLTSLVASSSGDPSKLVIDGYVTKQAARVRLILAGGNLPSTWSRCRAAARSRSTSSLRCFPGQGPRSSSRWSGSSPWTATGGQSPRAGLGLASQAAAASADAAAATGPRR